MDIARHVDPADDANSQTLLHPRSVMALSEQQVNSLSRPEAIPLGKIICCMAELYTFITCVRAAKGNGQQIAKCVQDLLAGVEKCLTG